MRDWFDIAATFAMTAMGLLASILALTLVLTLIGVMISTYRRKRTKAQQEIDELKNRVTKIEQTYLRA